MPKDINRLKIVLVEQKKTGKWLATLDALVSIAKLLKVDIKELINA